MCGIVGLVSSRPVDAGLLESMRDTLAHRGPDHAGAWYSEDRRVALGHRRLAIVDLSPDANQPFVSADGRYTLTFNGEIYNFKLVRSLLERSGHRFRTNSDTEVLIESYRAWGRKALDRLHGMFAFAIWDDHERRLFCARDRAGEKPFYYAATEDAFVFGSELKAIVRWPSCERRLHLPAVADFLTFSFIPDPSTIFEGCRKLPPAHYLEVELQGDGRPRAGHPVTWWDFEPSPEPGVEDWGPAIRGGLQSATKEMAFADVPVGTFLSGGVDSSSVTAALSQQGMDVTAFTIGFGEEAFDERPWAKRVVDRYAVPWHERTVVADDIEPVLSDLLWHYDEPFGDYSYLPTYYVCREARRHVTVALSGDGADETFAGYGKYQRLARMEQLRRVPAYGLAASGALLASRLPFSERRARTLRQYGSKVRTMLADALTLGWDHGKLTSVARGDLAATLADYRAEDHVHRHLDHVPPEQHGLVDAMRYLDVKLTLAGGILVKVDRASMAVSLEVRPVYLHPEMLSLARRLPAKRLAATRGGKRALKSALEPWLPRDLLYRSKMGFHMPLGRWLGESFPGLVERTASSPWLREWFEPGLFDRLYLEHRSGKQNHTAVLHNLIFLAGWLETWQPV
jgi:asparagine synthase (glutamine-hydrolysing)